MPEHAERVESLLHRPVEVRREPELSDRWAKEDLTKRVASQFETFKTSDEGKKWIARELNNIQAEERSLNALDTQVLRLKQKESLPDLPDPTAGFGLQRIPDFIKNENSANGEANWNVLRTESFAEVARNSRDLASAWEIVYMRAVKELEADGKLSFAQIQILKESMGGVWSDLGRWDKARNQGPMPDLRNTSAKWGWEFVTRHKAVFDKIDGTTSPTAKYKLLATFQAIAEMQARQKDNLSKPSYARMLDRFNEIARVQDSSLTKVFTKDAQYLANPQEVWKQLLSKANVDLRQLAVKESPDFVTRFGKMTGLVEIGDFRPAINFRSGCERLEQLLEQWPATKAPWPVTAEVWETAHRIAWRIENMKLSVDEAFMGGEAAREIRQSYHALLDAVAKRISSQLDQLQ